MSRAEGAARKSDIQQRGGPVAGMSQAVCNKCLEKVVDSVACREGLVGRDGHNNKFYERDRLGE